MDNWKDIHWDFSKKDYWRTESNQQLWEEQHFNKQQAAKLIKLGLKPKDHEFAAYLRRKGHNLDQTFNLERSRKEFSSWRKDLLAREYLDCFYPQEKRKIVKKLDIRNKNLKGSLDLNDFTNLEELRCSYNELTSLKLDNCLKLKEVECRNNYLQDLSLPSQAEQLTVLDITSNNFPEQDLSFFRRLVNLKKLDIGNSIDSSIDKRKIKEKIKQGIYNRFIGSLEPLQNLRKLEILGISNTDIDSGLEYLPENIEHFSCSADERKDSKCKVIYNLFINEKRKWTSGSREIDEFIKKYQLKANNLKGSLKWIPYEQFTDIEYLADGGFSKIYKAKLDNKMIALKSLNYSQGIKAAFFQEIANHKLFSSDRIVKCYGISQDPEAKNYLMVMDYIKDGNLKQFLQNNQLSFKDRFYQLWRITDGLKEIHKQGLTHRDFHAGNILNKNNKKGADNDVKCYIADLGLCRPANVEDKGKVYGVLPYVAPEVLRDKQYTQASDIYSFGIVAYEVLSGLPPYHEYAHDSALAFRICEGLRPNLDNVEASQLLKNLVKGCWDADPKKRPSASNLAKILNNWRKEIVNKKNTEFAQQFEEVKELNKKMPKSTTNLSYQTHPSAVYTSRLLDFKNLPQPRNSKEINDLFWNSAAQSLSLDSLESATQKRSEKKPVQQSKRRLSLSLQIDTPQKKTKLLEETKEQTYRPEPMVIEIQDKNLANFHFNFVPESIQQLQTKLEQEKVKSASLQRECSFYKQLFDDYLQTKKSELAKLSSLLNKEEKEWLEIYCEASQEDERIPFVKKQLKRAKDNLKEKLSEEELKLILKKQAKIDVLENQLGNLQIQNWQDIHLSFTPYLIQAWKKHNFTSEQARDWINIHSPTDQTQAIQEPEFYAWLKDIKQVDSDWVLNHGNFQALKQEYQASQQQPQILQSPYGIPSSSQGRNQ